MLSELGADDWLSAALYERVTGCQGEEEDRQECHQPHTPSPGNHLFRNLSPRRQSWFNMTEATCHGNSFLPRLTRPVLHAALPYSHIITGLVAISPLQKSLITTTNKV